MRRVFWFGLGVGATLFAGVKVRGYLRQARPGVIGRRVADSAAGIGDSVWDFTDRVRAAMVERETELRETLGLPD